MNPSHYPKGPLLSEQTVKCAFRTQMATVTEQIGHPVGAKQASV